MLVIFSNFICDFSHRFVGCMFVSGVLLVLVPLFTTVPALIFYALLYGFVAGSYIALVAVMLADSLGEYDSPLSRLGPKWVRMPQIGQIWDSVHFGSPS